MRDKKETCVPEALEPGKVANPDSVTSDSRIAGLALGEGGELFNPFFAEAAIGFSITDVAGRFLEANPAYCALTGYTEAELRALDFQTITHPDDLPRSMAKIAALLSGEISSFLIEKRYRRKDDIVVWVLNSVSVIRDNEGRPTNLVRLSQDITERMQLEDSLRQAEARTESILASIADVHILFNRHWHCLYVNEAVVRAIGRPREQIVGRTLWELYPDIVGTELERHYRRAMDERVTVNFDFHYQAQDTWWENRFYPVPLGLAVFATDITERKRAEESLKLFRSLLDRSSDAIEVVDPETLRFLDCNESACQALGYSREEFLALSVFDIDPKIDELTAAAVVAEMKRSGFAMFESIHRRKDGSTFPVEVNVKVIQLERAYRLAIVRDITERKRAEEALQESEERFRQLSEAAFEAIVLHDNGTILEVNQSFCRMYGYERAEVIGKSVLDLALPEFRELLLQKVRAGDSGSYEGPALRKDGTTFTAELAGKPIHYQGRVVRVAAIRDITEQKRNERRQAAQYAVTRVLAESATLAEATPQLLQVICESLRWKMGEFWCVSDSANFLRCVETWHVPALDATSFIEASRQTELAPGDGLPGRVWQSGQPAWIPEVMTDPRFARAAIAGNLGLRGAVAFPILLENQTLGVMLFFSRRAPEVDENLLKMMSAIGSQIGQFTERKQADEKLQNSEKYFRSLIENASDLITVADGNGIIRYESPSLERMLGYKPEERIGKSVFELLHPDDLPFAKRHFAKGMQNPGTVHIMESRFQHKDGSWHLVETTGINLLDDPVVAGIVVNSRDITERRRAEEARRESEERYRDLVEHSRELICTHDLDGRVLSANRAAAEALGYDSNELLEGKNIRDILAPEVRDEFEQYMASLRERGATSGIMLVETSTGERRIWEYYNSLRSEGVATPIVRGMARDITERKRAEEALLASEQKYRNIFENAGEGIFQTTPEGQYISANPALARMHGFANPEEFIGSRPDVTREVYVDPARREEFKKLIDEHSLVRGFEHQILRRDGSKIWVSVNARAVRDEQGEIRYYEGTTQDISERKRAEARNAAFASLGRKLGGARVPLEAARIVVNTADELFGWDSCTFDLYDPVENVINAILRVDTTDGLRTDVPPVLGKRPPSPRGRQAIEHGARLTLREPPYQFDDGLLRFGDKNRPSASIMTVPIRNASEVVGVLSIQSYQPRAYNNEALSDLQSLADHCGEALNRIRAERSLYQSEERYRELFENAKDALYVHDLSGRYVSFNRAAERLSGYSRDAIIGKHFSNFVAPGHLKYTRENLCKKLDYEGETTYEIDLVTKDRRRVPVEVSSSLIYENGEPIGVQGVVRDITDRKRAQEALRTYSRRLLEAQEAERQVIARELHDEIGQVLTAVRINLQSLRRSAETSSPLLPIDDSLVIVDEALERVRELSLNLRPSVLDNFGLASALRWYVDRYARRSGIVADLRSDIEDGLRLPVELETACFRIVQEALTNIARHAQATHVSVRLRRANGNLDLKVSDNGVGFDVQALLGSSASDSALGLRGMQERAVAVSGHLEIDSALMRGTEVRATFPLKDET